MSPGNVEKSQNNSKKTPQDRQKKEKAILKTPSIIKLKIKLPSSQDDTTQNQNIGNEGVSKPAAEKKTEEQITGEVKKKGRPKSAPQNVTVKSEDAVEEVKQPEKETVAKKQRGKKMIGKQSTKNKTLPVITLENVDTVETDDAMEAVHQPKKKTVVKRQQVKKIHNQTSNGHKGSPAKKIGPPARVPLENGYPVESEEAVEEVKHPDTNKKTAVKRQRVKKIQDGGYTTGDGEPMKKKARSKHTPENGYAVETKDTIKEVTQPITIKKTVVRRQRVKKVQNGGQASQRVKKFPAIILAPENDNVFQTEGIQGAYKVDNYQPDTLKLNEQYYKILTANEVINAIFPKKPKAGTITSPIEHSLQIDKTITNNKSSLQTFVRKKPVSNGKSVIKEKVLNTPMPGRKKPAGTKQCRSVRAKKVLNPKKINEKEKKVTKSRDKKIITTKIKKLSTKQNGNLSLKGKVVAGPKSRKLNEIITHTKNADIDIDKSNINDTCKSNTKASKASSNNSWTKEISTSSDSSLVSVRDFYVFNNKIPVLPLIDIENESRNSKRKTNLSDNSSNKCSKINRNMKADDLLSTSSPKSDVTKLPDEPNENLNYGDITEKNIAAIVAAHPPVNLSASSSSNSSNSSTSSSTSDTSCTSAVVSKSKDSRTSEIISKMKTNVLSKLNINKLALSRDTNGETENSNVNIVDVENLQNKLGYLEREVEIWHICQAIIKLEMDDVEKYFNHGEKQENTLFHSNTLESIYSQDSDVLHECDNKSKEYVSERIDNNEKSSSSKKEEAVASDESSEKVDNIGLDQSKSCPSKEKTVASNEVVEKIINNSLDQNKPNCSAYIDNDDDDALSIFAESIDLESCRKSALHGESTEEYVPLPVVPLKEQLLNYKPTKISYKNLERETIKYKSICEKQNAQPLKISNNNMEDKATESTNICERQTTDSTSLLIESVNNLDLRESSLIYEDRIGDVSQNYPSETRDVLTQNTQATCGPRLMESIHKKDKIRTQIYKDCCLFYIRNACSNNYCKYRHVHPLPHNVKIALARISEENFIQEYIYMRRYPKLRRKYVLCFVEEAIRRELSRIVVEMAIDCVVRSHPNSIIDTRIKKEALENILMYLNRVDLSTCDDLLRYSVCVNGQNNVLLCDVLMSTIATTQNFTRFKHVFISLTDFMCRYKRTFSVDVAESLLERLCILPYDESLARALLEILKNTDVTLFSNNKIQYLERQLLASNNDLYNELKLLKNKALAMQPVLANQYDHTYETLNASIDKRNTNFGNEQTIKPLFPNINKMNSNFGQSFQPLNSNVDKKITNFESTNQEMRIHHTADLDKNKPIKTKFKMTMDLDKLRQSGFLKNENTGHRPSFDNPFIRRKSARVIEVGENPNFNGILRDDNIRNQSMITPHIPGISVNNFANQTKQGSVNKPFVNYQNRFKRTPEPILQWTPRLPFKRQLDRSIGESRAPKFQRNNGPSHFQRDL